MASYWQRKRRSRWRGQTERPPTQAQRFSSEVGGGDKDVKDYFFSLKDEQLRDLFRSYGAKYGGSRQKYAEEAFTDWRLGRRQMRAIVAARLYALLPERMPLQEKYELVRKLWDSSRPKSRSHHILYVGKAFDLETLKNRISEHLGKVVQDHYFSEELTQRFEWLAAGDVHVRQQLQNYFEKLKRDTIVQVLKERMEVLSSVLENCNEDHIIQKVSLGNHIVEIRWTHFLGGINDVSTVKQLQNEKRRVEENALELQRQKDAKVEARNNAFGCLFMIVVAFALLKACAN